jgi:signal transduction histidine kinase
MPALEWLAGRMRETFGLAVSIKGESAFRLESDEMRVFAFEAVSELLMNVIKHAGVKAARVEAKWRGEDRIAIEVSDKGAGFDAEPRGETTAFGLFSIRERVEAFGGRFDVVSRPGEGTRAVLILPAHAHALPAPA